MKTLQLLLITFASIVTISGYSIVYAQIFPVLLIDKIVQNNTTNTNETNYTKKVSLWNYTPPSYPGPVAISYNGSFVTVGTRQDDLKGSIYFLDNNGIVLWSHLLSGFVKSVSMSSDGRFVEARTIQIVNNGGTDFGYNEWDTNPTLYVFDNSGQIIYQTGSTLNSGYVVRGSALSSNGGVLDIFDNRNNLLWEHADSSTPKQSAISSDGWYEVETVGESPRGYGLTVLFNKLEYGSAIPEFSLAIPVLLLSITSLIVFYRVGIRK